MNINLGYVNVVIGDEDIELDVDELIPIDAALDEEFMEQSSRYAYVAMLSARAEAQAYDAKAYVSEEYAKADKIVRATLADEGIKITEARVKNEILLREEYKYAMEYEAVCKEQLLLMKALVQALSMRADMLISLGAHLRSEAQQTGMHINIESKKLVDKVKTTLGK